MNKFGIPAAGMLLCLLTGPLFADDMQGVTMKDGKMMAPHAEKGTEKGMGMKNKGMGMGKEKMKEGMDMGKEKMKEGMDMAPKSSDDQPTSSTPQQ